MGRVTAKRPDEETEEKRADRTDRTGSHLDGVEPGAGCTEIWEHLSEQREREEE